MAGASQAGRSVAGVLLPVRCPLCEAIGPAPCAGCRARLEPPPRLAPPAGVDRCPALLAYRGAARELIIRLKYRNARASIGFLADGMAALVEADSVDVVTWVPTTPARRRRRGFDQAQLLARAVARRLRRPYRRTLRRRAGPAQTGRGAAERHRGPLLVARGGGRVAGARVLLVDDVVTTGATLAAGARALRQAGAVAVQAVAAARTPARIGAGRT